MERNGIFYISESYTRNDYLALNLDENSSNKDWKRAVDIFYERIYGRFLKPADLLSNEVEKNGFAIMTLLTPVIETLAQFKEGINNSRGCSKDLYIRFLQSEFSDLFNRQKLAESFYHGVRCGILHSAQTQNNVVLTTQDVPIRVDNNRCIFINVPRMLERVKCYIKEYTERLVAGEDRELRCNFITKMECICNR